MKKIFIVEDEWVVSLELQQRLTDLGYEVSGITDNGDSAIKMALETKPDLILIDINIKGNMDGIETAKQILAKYNVPIIYLTAYSDKTTIERTKVTTPYGYIIKPVEERDLLVSIEISLNKFEMEKKLKESEKKLSITLQSIGDGVIATNENGLITLMNRTAEKMCGWTFNEAKGLNLKKVFNIKSAINQNPINNPLEEVLRTGKFVELANHTILISREGTERHISDSAAPICDDSGEIQGVVLVFSDVTESYTNRELLKQSEKMLHLIIDIIPDRIFVKDIEGKYILNNISHLMSLGLNNQVDAVGKTDYNFLSNEAAEINEAEDKNVIENQIPLIDNCLHEINENNLETWRLVSKLPFKTNDGKIMGTVGISKDITERKKLELGLMEAKEKAEAASELKDAFIANISHEIRTPLNGVLGMTSVIKDVFSKYITPIEEEFFIGIDRSTKRIIRTVDMILNFSRLQVGEFKFEPQKIDLNDILFELYEEYNLVAKHKGLVFTFENKIGKVLIQTDTYCFNQVFSNLLDNAVKYTETGSIEIVIYKNIEDNINIDVRDTGIGISEEYLDQIFNPYSQEEVGYTRTYDGVGLGLSLVKKFLSLLGADISVRSKKGVGTTFTITFISLS
jgi:PAS domain S-box-containing protein